MILTTCAACAAPLAHDAPRCVRCKLRYCNATCQHDHWRRGHKQMCKKIHRGGNAEQYNADKKYKEAVAEAVEKCADDTKGQKCYICLEAVHPRTGEGLVRGCACGDRDGVSSPELGVAHVSCLADQAKHEMSEGEEINASDAKLLNEKLRRWNTCSLCEQMYHGVVFHALGWACWKTYLGRPEEDWCRRAAMTQLACGLHGVSRHEEQLRVLMALEACQVRTGQGETDILQTNCNIALCYNQMGRLEEALELRRKVYARSVKLVKREGLEILGSNNVLFVFALNLSVSLKQTGRFEEAKSFLRAQIPKARRALCTEHSTYIKLRWNLAACLCCGDGVTRADMVEAITIYEELAPTARRIYGPAHPMTHNLLRDHEAARLHLASFETPSEEIN